MQTPIKLAGFGAMLASAFAAAAGLGALVGPLGPAENPSAHARGDSEAGVEDGAQVGMDMSSQAGSNQSAGEPAMDVPGGLMVTQDGYTLKLTDTELSAGEQRRVGFRILGPDGGAVTDYSKTHGKDLHLIAIRRDLTGYQHVHPVQADDGTWTAQLALPNAGEYRVFADFQAATAKEAVALGADLSVAGSYDPQPLPAASRTASVDEYQVTLDGTLVAGEESKLTLSVAKDGEPVTDLQPYLEAYGHLVALRDGDLAYLHVHPAGTPGDAATKPGPDVTFFASVPSNGDYRLFLDFRHQDRVRTAALSVQASSGEGTAATNQPPTSSATPAPNGDADSDDANHDH